MQLALTLTTLKERKSDGVDQLITALVVSRRNDIPSPHHTCHLADDQSINRTQLMPVFCHSWLRQMPVIYLLVI